MDHAVQNAFDYLGRHTDCPDKKLAWRIKSVIKRAAPATIREEESRSSIRVFAGSGKSVMLVNQRQSKEPIRTNCSRGFRRLPSR